MGAKLFGLFVIIGVISQGYCVTEITLEDETTSFITNPFIGKTIGIAKSFLDTLEACYVTFPSGVMYEAFPHNDIPDERVQFLSAVQPFTSCGIGFLGVPTSFSGTYELFSQVRHSSDDSQSLTRKKFHITFVASELYPELDH